MIESLGPDAHSVTLEVDSGLKYVSTGLYHVSAHLRRSNETSNRTYPVERVSERVRRGSGQEVVRGCIERAGFGGARPQQDFVLEPGEESSRGLSCRRFW